MILLISQIVVTALLFAVLFMWLRGQRKQKAHSTDTWEALVSQLHGNEWGLEEISERYLYRAGITATSADIWQRIDGANGLWAMYKNTTVLLKLASYAAEHSDSTNETLIEALRADAFAIRLSVITALLKYAFSRSTVGAAVNAHRAATAYTEMLFHLTTLFQEHSAQLFPRYLQAM